MRKGGGEAVYGGVVPCRWLGCAVFAVVELGEGDSEDETSVLFYVWWGMEERMRGRSGGGSGVLRGVRGRAFGGRESVRAVEYVRSGVRYSKSA